MEEGDDGPAVYRLSEMSGYDFEEAVRTLLDRLGYRAEVTAQASDFGRDVIAESASETVVVECKNHASGVGRPVVQKLHSATVSFDGDAVGLVVCPGGFSKQAREHARELGDRVRLWGFSELVERGRSVDVYFVTEEAGTEYVFECRPRSDGEIEELFERRFVGNLTSEPRAVDRVTRLKGVGRRRIPALRIQYELDETFGSSTYPNLHRARERGTRIVLLERGESDAVEMPNWEREFWADLDFDRRRTEPVGEKPPAALFGVDPSRYEREIRRELVHRHSTTVSYTGKNNQTYTKECRVEPEDVDVETIQVLLVRQTVEFEVGPRAPHLSFTGAADFRPKLVHARSIAPDEAREVWRGRPGLVCNDCAAIETTARDSVPVRCESCSRTLCTDHHWDVPRGFLWGAEPSCSDCYRRVSDEHPELEESGLDDNLAAALSVLAPPAGLFGEGYRAAGFGVFLVVAAAVGTPVAAGYTGPRLGLGMFAAAFVWLAAAIVIVFRVRRVRRHLRNLEQIGEYQPLWAQREES